MGTRRNKIRLLIHPHTWHNYIYIRMCVYYACIYIPMYGHRYTCAHVNITSTPGTPYEHMMWQNQKRTIPNRVYLFEIIYVKWPPNGWLMGWFEFIIIFEYRKTLWHYPLMSVKPYPWLLSSQLKSMRKTTIMEIFLWLVSHIEVLHWVLHWMLVTDSGTLLNISSCVAWSLWIVTREYWLIIHFIHHQEVLLSDI